MENVDSHIQMPKCILKNFVNEQKSFYYYDVAESKVKMNRPKSLNAQNGYYSGRVEHMLQQIVESPLGNILKYVKENDFSEPIDIPRDFENITMAYIHSLIARAPHMYETIEKHSIFLQFLSGFNETDKHDFAVNAVLGKAKNNSPFKNYIVTMLVNKTGIPLLLPIGGMYSYGDFICAPISINKAIALTKKDSNLCDELIDGEVCKVLIVENESVLHKMNRFAIQSEISHNKQYVVSVDKVLLETYLKEMQLIK
jgi:hypothetical protein